MRDISDLNKIRVEALGGIVEEVCIRDLEEIEGLSFEPLKQSKGNKITATSAEVVPIPVEPNNILVCRNTNVVYSYPGLPDLLLKK